MTSTPPREVAVAAVKRLGRAVATPSGALAATTGAAGLWAVAGLPGARVVGAIAIVVGVGLLLYLAHDGNVRAREAVARAKAARDVADQTTRRVHELNKGNAQLKNANRRLGETVETMSGQLADARKRLRAADRRARQAEAVATRATKVGRRAHRAARHATAVAREAARAQRDDLTAALNPVRPDDHWPDVPARVATPVLSIAVVGANDPRHLQHGLDVLLPQVDAATAPIEIVIVDDSSPDRRVPDLGRYIAKANDAVGFHRNPTAVGSEQRCVDVTARCRGEWLWVLDDAATVVPDAVEVVLADIRSADEALGVLLYATAAIDSEGRSVLTLRGTEPADLSADAAHTFPRLLELGRHPGLAGTIGLLERVVVRRNRIAAIDPSPYLGLTMGAGTAVILAAAAHSPVRYRNTAVATSRVLTEAEAVIEAAGRPDESFAAGGAERDMRWFGAAYAAMLHRLTTITDLDPATFLDHAEMRWTDAPLIDWIESNWVRATRRGVRLPADVLTDAEAFFAAIGRPPPGKASQ